MKITSVILALSAVIALTQAQTLDPTNIISNPLVGGAVAPAQGVIEKVKGVTDPVVEKVKGIAGSATGGLPQAPTLRRRQNVGETVNTVKNVVGQTLPANIPSLPLRKRGPVEFIEEYPGTVVNNLKDSTGAIVKGIQQKVGELTQQTGAPIPAALKRGLAVLPDLAGTPLNAEELAQKLPALKSIVESAYLSAIKKVIEEKVGEASHVVVFVGHLKKEVVDLVVATVDTEVKSLILQVSGTVGVDLLAVLQSALEHACTVLVPKVNEVLQQYALTKDIVLETPQIADLTLANIIPKAESIVSGLKPKVDETVSGLKPKVDETVKTVKDKVDEVKSTVPVGVPEVPVV
ncbi:hypothetical protein BGZ75_001019 [Mortierella antarctica]|nr:hypothetical protein BGZ75_001019 [Mortierella antarctica]